MQTLLTIGAFFALPYIFYAVIQTARRHADISTFGTVLACAALIIPLAVQALEIVTGTSKPLTIAAALASAGIVVLFSLIIFVLDLRRPNHDLNHSYGPLGMGVGLLLVAGTIITPSVIAIFPNALAAAQGTASNQTINSAGGTPSASSLASVLSAQTGLASDALLTQINQGKSIADLVNAQHGDMKAVTDAFTAALTQMAAQRPQLLQRFGGDAATVAAQIVNGQAPAQLTQFLLPALISGGSALGQGGGFNRGQGTQSGTPGQGGGFNQGGQNATPGQGGGFNQGVQNGTPAAGGFNGNGFNQNTQNGTATPGGFGQGGFNQGSQNPTPGQGGGFSQGGFNQSNQSATPVPGGSNQGSQNPTPGQGGGFNQGGFNQNNQNGSNQSGQGGGLNQGAQNATLAPSATVVPTNTPLPTRTPEPTATLIPTSTPLPSVTAEATSACSVTTQYDLNMRAAPNKDGGLILTIPAATSVPSNGNNGNGWWQVTYQDKTGWVDGNYVTPGAECDGLPTLH